MSKREKCPLCHSDNSFTALDLGYHPLADTFNLDDSLPDILTLQPLIWDKCSECHHVYLEQKVSRELRYQAVPYSYTTGNSRIALEHFDEFAQEISESTNFENFESALDIGGNDGTLLKGLQKRGIKKVWNIEPSENISKISVQNGVNSLNKFFDSTILEEFKGEKIDLIVSANVVNHIDDTNELLSVVNSLLSPEGSFVFQVPYLLELLKRKAFETIYHEHVHYFSITALEPLLAKYGFSIFKVSFYDYMCGSVRVFAKKNPEKSAVTQDILKNESEFGIENPDIYEAFQKDIEKIKLNLLKQVIQTRIEDGKIVGFSAATKGNTLLNFCGLTPDLISCICDTSPLKIGKRTPGTGIKIISENDIPEECTHALILAENLNEILIPKIKAKNLNLISLNK